MKTKTSRIHYLDAIRAIMMLLGLVLHTCASYGEVDKLEEWPFLDPINQSIVFDVLLALIHLFRMPVFFVVSGFFGAMLFYERSPRKMLINRFKRVLLPFLAALLVLTPIIYLAFRFSILQFAGNSNSLALAWSELKLENLSPLTTSHLWFLFYLIQLTIIGAILAFLLQNFPIVKNKLRKCFLFIHKSDWTKIFLLAIPILILFKLMNAVDVYTSTSIIPDWRTLAYYGIFYFYGWLLFREKSLLDTFKNHYKRYLLAGVVLFFGKVFLYLNVSPTFSGIIIANALAVWCFVIGMLGFFSVFFKNKSAKMRYVSDASYWVYLIHLPLVAFLPGLMFHLDIFVFFKWGIVIGFTTAFSFLTYHFFVRSTFIGKFLNGRRY